LARTLALACSELLFCQRDEPLAHTTDNVRT
jgi:hypothetical protein